MNKKIEITSEQYKSMQIVEPIAMASGEVIPAGTMLADIFPHGMEVTFNDHEITGIEHGPLTMTKPEQIAEQLDDIVERCEKLWGSSVNLIGSEPISKEAAIEKLIVIVQDLAKIVKREIQREGE